MDDYRDYDYQDQQDEKKERNAVIEECALIAKKISDDHRQLAKEFEHKALDNIDPQHKIAQATHAILSVNSMRIANEIRKLKK